LHAHSSLLITIPLDDSIAQQQEESSTASAGATSSTGDNNINDDGGNAQQQLPQSPSPPLQSDYDLFSKSIAKILPANRKFASLTQLHQFMKLFMSFWDVPRLGTYSYINSKQRMSASIQRGSYYISLFFFPRAPNHNHSHRSTPRSYNLPSSVAVAVSTQSHPG
jgi:hypothetical protein